MSKLHAPAPATPLALLAARCRAQGVALTVQRRTIYEALAARHDHPTADELYTDVQIRLPGVSRTTVYRVLDALVRLGVARRASHLGPASRFDPNVGRHHHLVCMRCDRVTDLEAPALDALRLPNTRAVGFTIDDYSIDFRGICRSCRGRGRRPARTKVRKEK